MDEALKVIQKAEKYAIIESDKVLLRQFKAKIQEVRGKEKEFSKNIFATWSKPLYEDKPL